MALVVGITAALPSPAYADGEAFSSSWIDAPHSFVAADGLTYEGSSCAYNVQGDVNPSEFVWNNVSGSDIWMTCDVVRRETAFVSPTWRAVANPFMLRTTSGNNEQFQCFGIWKGDTGALLGVASTTATGFGDCGQGSITTVSAEMEEVSRDLGGGDNRWLRFKAHVRLNAATRDGDNFGPHSSENFPTTIDNDLFKCLNSSHTTGNTPGFFGTSTICEAEDGAGYPSEDRALHPDGTGGYVNPCDRMTIDGPDPDEEISGGDSVTFTFSWVPGNHPFMLWFRFPGSMSHPLWRGIAPVVEHAGSSSLQLPVGFVPYQTLWWPENATVDTDYHLREDPLPVEITLPDSVSGVHLASEIKLACLYTTTTGDTEVGYIDGWGGDSVASVDPPRSCDRVSIMRPFHDNDDGTATISFSGNQAAGGSDVGPIDIEQWDGDSWVMVADDYISLGDDGTADYYTVDLYGGTMAELRLRCTDEVGTTEGGAWRGGPEYVGISSDGEQDGCISASGIGLSPSSWVPGLVSMVGCTLHGLFVPDESSVGELVSSAEYISRRAPVSFIVVTIGGLIDVFSDAPGAVLAHRNDCLTIVDGIAGLDDGEACPAEIANGALTMLRTIAGVAMWAASLYTMWGATRRVLTS